MELCVDARKGYGEYFGVLTVSTWLERLTLYLLTRRVYDSWLLLLSLPYYRPLDRYSLLSLLSLSLYSIYSLYFPVHHTANITKTVSINNPPRANKVYLKIGLRLTSSQVVVV